MDDRFETLARRAAKRYAGVSYTAMNFARGKIAGDPVYRQAIAEGVLPSHGTLIDIGCGQGLMLALLGETAQFDRLVGVEMRPRMAYLARKALGAQAEIVEADARSLSFENCSAAILFDVLQAMSPAQQDELLAVVAGKLEPGGVLLLREADASAGWRFRMVSVGNEIKARCIGTWHGGWHYRTRAEWQAALERHGMEVEVYETETRNPLGNVLLRGKRR